MQLRISEKGQAMPREPIPIAKEAFDRTNDTVLHWLGSAGVMVNARGTTLMLDPLLEGFDLPVLFESPGVIFIAHINALVMPVQPWLAPAVLRDRVSTDRC